jgi:lipid-A-disaccharide synthase
MTGTAQRAPQAARPPLNVGIVAGESSGDRLGAALIAALRAARPDVRVVGMAGPRMLAAGCEPLAHIDELSVMGLVEVLRSYPRLLRLRRRLGDGLLAAGVRVVVGIDVPDFNLGLERRLKCAGVATVHWVCPQAWAWRPGRAAALAPVVDRLLALFPFEPDFFAHHGVVTEFVGHPLADELPLEPARAASRAALGVPAGARAVALMPGSRSQELARLLGPFLAAARLLRRNHPEVALLLCTAREDHAARARAALDGLPCTVLSGRSHEVLSAADVALVASGTVSLEALLCGTPMVVGYRLAPLSYHIIRRMVSIPRIALPNILAGREVVPELLQGDMTPTAMAHQLAAWLDDAPRREAFAALSRALHRELRRDAAAGAAAAVLRLAETGR